MQKGFYSGGGKEWINGDSWGWGWGWKEVEVKVEKVKGSVISCWIFFAFYSFYSDI